ncbi:DUF5819 family protein [Streptomyces sp. NPDC054855]
MAGAALLAVHFTASALSQAPLSPAKMRYYDTVSAYLEPYFTQNWMLFAPDPLTDDRGILARAACPDGKVTPEYDVTSAYIEKAQSSRFFPSRMSRLVTSNIQQLSPRDEVLDRMRRSERNDKKPVTPLLPHEKKSRGEAVTFLSRYALDQMPAGVCSGKPEKIQIVMYLRKLPPWSQRNNIKAKDKVDAYRFEWRKVGDLR